MQRSSCAWTLPITSSSGRYWRKRTPRMCPTERGAWRGADLSLFLRSSRPRCLSLLSRRASPSLWYAAPCCSTCGLRHPAVGRDYDTKQARLGRYLLHCCIIRVWVKPLISLCFPLTTRVAMLLLASTTHFVLNAFVMLRSSVTENLSLFRFLTGS